MAALEASSPDDPPLLGPRRADHRQHQHRQHRRRRRRQWQRRREGRGSSNYSHSSSSSSSSSLSWWSNEGGSVAEDACSNHQAVAGAAAAPRQFLVAFTDQVRSFWARQPRRMRIGLAYLLAIAILPFLLLTSLREAWARALVIAPPVAGLLLAQWAAGSLLD